MGDNATAAVVGVGTALALGGVAYVVLTRQPPAPAGGAAPPDLAPRFGQLDQGILTAYNQRSASPAMIGYDYDALAQNRQILTPYAQLAPVPSPPPPPPPDPGPPTPQHVPSPKRKPKGIKKLAKQVGKPFKQVGKVFSKLGKSLKKLFKF